MAANTNTYDNVVGAGAASVTVIGIVGSPTAYTAYDVRGNVIATGSMTGSSVTIPAPGGSWPAGHALILFTKATWNAATGYVTDSVQVLALRSGIGTFPPLPAVGTSPSAGDPNGRGVDQYMHGQLAMGLNRWAITDAAAPTVYTPGPEQGATTANIQAALALENGAAGYSNPAYADPARPRSQFVTFPNTLSSAPGYAAGVASVVAAVGPSTVYGARYFEGLNEPSQPPAGSLTPTQSAAQFDAFATAVHAGDATAKAMGSAEVTYSPIGAAGFAPQCDSLRTFLAALTTPLNAFCFHMYNGYNGDFLVTDGWLAAVKAELATAGYPANLPFFMTENSVNDMWDCWNVQRMVAWTALFYLTADRFGCPKENIYWFFDTDVGFWPFGMRESKGELRPMSVFFRAFSEEVFGKAYDSALDFGAIGNGFYRGNVYRGAGGTTVAIVAQGNPSDSAVLAVSDPGPITCVRTTGETFTVAVAGGRITVPISHHPVYVRLSAGCSVSVVDVGDGLAGSPTNIATAATATSSGGASFLSRVNNGVLETGGYLPGPDYMCTIVGLPAALTLTWATPQQFRKILIRQAAPWENYNESCAMTRGKLEYWNGSGWLPCPTTPVNHWDARGNYDNETATCFLGQVGGHPKMISFYDQHWNFNVGLAHPITTTKLRWTVAATGYGDLPNKDAAAFFPNFLGTYGETGPSPGQRLMCSEIVVIRDTSTPPTIGPFPA